MYNLYILFCSRWCFIVFILKIKYFNASIKFVLFFIAVLDFIDNLESILELFYLYDVLDMIVFRKRYLECCKSYKHLNWFENGVAVIIIQMKYWYRMEIPCFRRILLCGILFTFYNGCSDSIRRTINNTNHNVFVKTNLISMWYIQINAEPSNVFQVYMAALKYLCFSTRRND